MTTAIAPVQLIRIDDSGQCHVTEEAVKLLSQFDGKLAVVGIAGPYRTGKSFLLNRLLGVQAGFDVGPTVNPCTKGLWIWGKPIPLFPDSHCIFLDTEGLGSTQRTASCDMQIFSLCVLLSSYFIYNSMGAIDEQALDDLHLVLHLAKHIHVKSQDVESAGDVSPYFPYFLWVLRDFHLRREDANGAPMTNKEYLESSLNEVRGQDDKNKLRSLIKDLFKDRDCITLPRPAADEEELRKLENLSYDSLRPQFRTQLEEFVEKVYGAVKPKQIGDLTLSGPMLVSLATEYCNAINNSVVPTIQSAWTSAVQQQMRTVMKQALQVYKEAIEAQVSDRMPINEEQLQSIHKAAEDKAIQLFRATNVDENEPSFQQSFAELSRRVDHFFQRIRTENSNASLRQCQWVAESLYTEIIDARLSSNNGYKDFEQIAQDWNRLQAEYMRRTAGPAQAEVLSTWLLQRMTYSMQRVHTSLQSMADKRSATESTLPLDLDQRLQDATRNVEDCVRRNARKLEPMLCSSASSQSKHLEAGLHQGPHPGTAVADGHRTKTEGANLTGARSKTLAPVLCDGLTPPQTTPPRFGSAPSLSKADVVSEHTHGERGRDCELRVCPLQ